MNLAIPTSADQGALPPGLAEAAAAHLEPGEALCWAGRGKRLATFLALAPGMALTGLLLGLFAAPFFAIEFDDRGADLAWQLSPNMMARGFAFAILALLLYYLALFVGRIVSARRDYAAVTNCRLVIVVGRKSLSFGLGDIESAEVRGTSLRPVLAFQTLRGQTGKEGPSPTLFGVANVDAALAEFARLGIATSDRRRGSPVVGERAWGLALGETIKWSGRRGLGAVGSARLILLTWTAPALLLLALGSWWIWRAWSEAPSTGDPLWDIGFPAFQTLLPAVAVGSMALGFLQVGGPFFRELVVDIFGKLAVTDRRILFTYPVTGRVAREFTSERLQGADLVEFDDSGRGQIVLTLAQENREEPEWLDLFAVPDAAGAVKAMTRLVRR